ALARSAQEVVQRRAIVEALGEDYLQYDQRRLDTQVRRLRRKVEEACGVHLPLATVRGVGYRFFAAVVIEP
ncbi:MAG TPA: helix-turn-helix domain-containing protein, partial [Ramlibacter sp.]